MIRCLHQPEGLCPRCRFQEDETLAWKAEQLRAVANELNQINAEVKEFIESGELFRSVFGERERIA